MDLEIISAKRGGSTLNFRLGPTTFLIHPYEGQVMGRITHHYLVFETASGFCGIA